MAETQVETLYVFNKTETELFKTLDDIARVFKEEGVVCDDTGLFLNKKSDGHTLNFSLRQTRMLKIEVYGAIVRLYGEDLLKGNGSDFPPDNSHEGRIGEGVDGRVSLDYTSPVFKNAEYNKLISNIGVAVVLDQNRGGFPNVSGLAGQAKSAHKKAYAMHRYASIQRALKELNPDYTVLHESQLVNEITTRMG
jgi:hypothetical protein